VAFGTFIIEPSRDNSIYEETIINSNGASECLLPGVTNAGFKNRALINFDVAGNIPSWGRDHKCKSPANGTTYKWSVRTSTSNWLIPHPGDNSGVTGFSAN